MQTRLDQRMIEDGVLFASGHEREACYIGEHSPGAILAVESRASRVPVGAGTP
jgi:hypothetical protein